MASRSLLITLSALCFVKALAAPTSEYLTPGFRPPSVPLVVIDPYISVWSNNDQLYDDVPKHWSGSNVSITGMIMIDGKAYRFMSNEDTLASDCMLQVDLKVYPTQTVYSFEQDGIQLNLTFSTPAYVVPGQLPYLPMTFITYEVASIDNQNHQVKIYYDNTAEVAVDSVSEAVEWNRVDIEGKVAMRIGSKKQIILDEGKDRINWGFWYVAVQLEDGLEATMANSALTRAAFINEAKLPEDDKNQRRACSDNWPVLAVTWDLGIVQATSVVTKHLTIIYDQVVSIRYFGVPMTPYWKHVFGDSIENLITKNIYQETIDMCDMADDNIMSKLYSVGGSNYTTIASLAWRQAVGGTVTVWNEVREEIWMFMKEISSDGDVSTVDVMYPSSPLFLWWDRTSIEALMKPVLEYASNNTFRYSLYIPYNLPWAPHHLGHWPVCDLLPSNQEQMPMEESGNMILMTAGSVFNHPTQNVTWLKPYWKVLVNWGDYIVASLPDPKDQLCTDDFEGPTPHNVNLAAKGILAVRALSYLFQLGGEMNLSDHYLQVSKDFVQYWLQNATDVDHYRLEYNETGTWSLKYNLFYQKVLKFDLFPESVFETELEYYFTQMNEYGIPLDNRANFTKTDWLMWVAAMGDSGQFKTIVDAVYKFANETPDRYPFTDWYDTESGNRTGFMARPVIGGLYAKMLLCIVETQ